MSTPSASPGPTRSAARLGRDPLDQRVVHGVVHDHPAGAGAGLPGQPEGALGDQRRGPVEVGVVQDDDRVLAAHLQLGALAGGATARWIASPTAVDPVKVTASTRSSVTSAEPTSAPPCSDGDRAGRQPALEQRVDQPLAEQRGDLAGLEDDAVAGGERRAELAGRDVEREVPRRDRGDDADRPAQGQHQAAVAGRQGHAGGAQRLAGVEAQVHRRAARPPSWPRPGSCPPRGPARRSASPAARSSTSAASPGPARAARARCRPTPASRPRPRRRRRRRPSRRTRGTC